MPKSVNDITQILRQRNIKSLSRTYDIFPCKENEGVTVFKVSKEDIFDYPRI